MRNNQTSKMTALAMAATFTLAACGGGGGGNSTPTPPSTPPTPTNVNIAPQTSVAAPTYSAASAQSAMFLALNSYRSQVGVGMVSQNTNLDNAAQAHAMYEQVNFNSGAITSLTHTESSSNPGFFEATPYQRSIKAGSAVNLWVGENIAADLSATGVQATDGASCMQAWINSVYHLQAATANQTSVGLGYAAPVSATSPFLYCVADFGVVSSPAPTDASSYNSIAYDGGQQIPLGTIAHAPFAGETGVQLAMHVESPNPAPDIATPGRPIMVRVNEQLGNKLTVDAFQLTDPSGAVVSARIIVPSTSLSGSVAGATADVNNELESGVAFLLPLAPLKANTVYTVTFAGKRDGVAVASTWQFTTAAQ